MTVLEGQLSAAFDYVDGSTATTVTVTATLGASTSSSTVTLVTATGSALVINEVDYDQIGTDTAEFAEIYNGGSAAVTLTGFNLVLVNGANNAVYKTVDLGPAGMLMPGQYLVVGSDAALANVAAGALKISFGASTDYIQNGSPDGVALVDSVNHRLVDALSYECAMTAVTIAGLTGTISLVEGTALPATMADSNSVQGSLCRLPNGADTDDAATDWKFSGTPTPGAANVP